MGSSAVNEHGIDIILGGHDHFYYVSKFSPDACWEGYDVNERVLGAENDDGVLVIKSGTDFRDLSDIRLGIEDSPPGSVRTKYISAVQGNSCDDTAIRAFIFYRRSTYDTTGPRSV